MRTVAFQLGLWTRPGRAGQLSPRTSWPGGPLWRALVSVALAGLTWVSGGDQPQELVSSGVKVLVVATSHLCPRSEITGAAHHTGVLEAPGKPVRLLKPPPEPDPLLPHTGLSRGRAPGDYFKNPRGSGQGSDSQRKQPSPQLPGPGSSWVGADIPEPSPPPSAAAAHVHFHSLLLPQPLATPVVLSTSHPHSHMQGAAAKRHPSPGPQRAAPPVRLLRSLPAPVRGRVARRPSEPA